jgi:small-conductance mechanosensitive channel
MIADRFAAVLALTIALFPGVADAAVPIPQSVVAQITLPTAAPAQPADGLVVEGMYVTAPIVLDGATLFRIAAPVNARVTQLPIAMRVAQVQSALSELLAVSGSGNRATTIFEPASLRVHLKHEGDVSVLEVVDAKHTDPLPVLTVNSTDADANGMDEDALAAQWQSILQTALVTALQLRQPATELRSAQRVGDLAIVLVVVSILVVTLLRFLWMRMEILEKEVAQRDSVVASEMPVAAEQPQANTERRRFFASALRNLEPTQRLRLYGATAETLMWGLLFVWFVGVTWSLSLFAQTTPLAQSIGRSAINVAATIFATGLLNRVLDIVIARSANAWRLHRRSNSDDRARFLLRIPTIAGAVAGAKTFVLIFLAALTIFGQIGVPIGSVVTIGGLAAIALSLAAQNFVRDFLNGFLVLLEDQYVVGDYVTINAFSGSVELLSLRMVQIRDAAGDLITIPHSSVINVVNQSRNWSRVDYRVPVDPTSDVPKAMNIVHNEIDRLLSEGDWTHGVASPVEWVGIDSLSKDGVIVRVSIRTAPLRQFELRRQINARVQAAFLAAGIALGAPLPAP